PLRDRNGLLLAAGYAPAYSRSALDGPELSTVRTALRHILTGHQPYPAIVIDRYGDLVEANAAFDVMTEGASPALLEPPINVYRLALHPDGIAARVVNSGELAQHVVERFQAELARNPDQRLAELCAEFEELARDRPRATNLLGFAVP